MRRTRKIPATKVPKFRRFRLQTLFEHIGNVTITWAFLDDAVDDLIDTIHQTALGKKIGEPPRTSFSRKITYLRECGKHFEKSEIARYKYSDFVDLLERASEHRHQLIHGVIANLGQYPDLGIARMLRYLRKQDRTRIFVAHYNSRDVRDFAKHLLTLWTAIAAFDEALKNLRVPKDKADHSFSTALGQVGGIFPFPQKRRHPRFKSR